MGGGCSFLGCGLVFGGFLGLMWTLPSLLCKAEIEKSRFQDSHNLFLRLSVRPRLPRRVHPTQKRGAAASPSPSPAIQRRISWCQRDEWVCFANQSQGHTLPVSFL